MEQLTAFYMAIKQHLNAIGIFKQIDWYKGQLEQEEQGTGDTLILPAAFLRVEPIQWQQMSQRRQRGELVFEIITADYNRLKSRSGNSDAAIEDALSSLSFVKEVKKALAGKSINEINLAAIAAGTENLMQTTERYTAHVQQFRAKIEDETTAVVYTPSTGNVGLELELKLKTRGIN